MPHTFSARLLLLILMTIASKAALATPHEHHQNSHENTPHIHGLATIQLLISPKKIALNLESPANNIVGFEHSAVTEEDQKKLLSAKNILSRPQSLFEFHGASCSTLSSNIDMNDLQHPSAEHSHHATHKEITALYEFQCNHTHDLESISVHLFKHFPNMTEINIQWVSDTKQGASRLKANNIRLLIGD